MGIFANAGTWLGEAGAALVLVFVVGAVTVWFIWHAFLYWVGARLARIEGATFGQALKAALAAVLSDAVAFGLMGLGVWAVMKGIWPAAAWWWVLCLWLGLLAAVGAPVLILKWTFHADLGRALAAYFSSAGICIVVAMLLFPAAGLVAHVYTGAAPLLVAKGHDTSAVPSPAPPAQPPAPPPAAVPADDRPRPTPDHATASATRPAKGRAKSTPR